MLSKTFTNMFLLILLFSSGEAIQADISTSDHDTQSFSISSFPQSYPSCFTEGRTWSTEEAADIVEGTPSVYSCQDICFQSPNCQHFTWYDGQANSLALTCFLYDDTTVEYSCTNCVSRPQSCTCGGHFLCQFTDNNFIGQFSHVETEIFCQDHCFKSSDCHYYNWFDKDSAMSPYACLMFSSCDEKLFSCNNCHSGPADCQNKTTTTMTPSTSTTKPTTTTSSTPTTTTRQSTTTTATTSSTTASPNPTCDIPNPQEHGDWFCPPSSEPATCHLECHPGYVSNNGTVITCQDGEWSSAPSCVAAVALITGTYSHDSQNTVEVYSEGLHLLLPNLPDNRYVHSLDLVDSAVLLCGGPYTKTSCLVLTSSQQWASHSTTTSHRCGHSSVSALGQLHLLGGHDSSSTSEYLGRSSTTWSEGWQLLEGSDGACTAKVDAEVAIMTGGISHQSSVISYNVTSGAATRLQDLISPTYSHGCCYIRDEGFRGVLVAGGDGDFSQLYDINNGEWSTTGTLTAYRSGGVRLFVIGDQILASGGSYGSSTVDRFNLTSRTWKAAENMLEWRRYHAVTGVPPSAVGIGSD